MRAITLFETPNIRHLRVFLAVVEAKSISQASGKVFLSQPAITQAIAKLETSFKTSLFQRRSDGMFTTTTGMSLAHRLQRSMQMILDGIKGALRYSSDKNTAKPSYLLSQVSTTQLNALIAVSEAQTFSMASRNRGVSQSSLYRAAKDLENLLGVKLFEKTSTGISSSKAARILTQATKLAFSEIVQAYDEIQALQNNDIGHMTIGSMPLARSSVLPKAIIEFSKKFPDVKLSITDGSYNDLLYHLRHGNIDLLIGALRLPAPSEDINQEELFSSSVKIIARPEHPLCKQKNVTAEQLAEYSWVVPQPGTPTRNIFESLFTTLPAQLTETGSQALILSLLRDSDRLSIISEHQVQHELKTKTLSTIPYNQNSTFRPIGITTRKSWQPTKTQQLFIDLLRNHGSTFNHNAP
jgi:DNA-binding transcriptional LysR family regulator